MRWPFRRVTVLLTAVLLVSIVTGSVRASSHCASRARIIPTDVPGTFRIDTAHGRTVARWPPPAPLSASQSVITIHAFAGLYDSDGDTVGTPFDTLYIAAGTTVRWQLVDGIHTVTNGKDSGDPNAGLDFNFLLDGDHPTFERTFNSAGTVDYFCFFHEPFMYGRIVVLSGSGVPESSRPGPGRFVQAPAPNPTRGTLDFSIALDVAQVVAVGIYDLQGRKVADVSHGRLPQGEHTLRWDGMTLEGRRARAGVYLVHVRGEGFSDSRKFTMIP